MNCMLRSIEVTMWHMNAENPSSWFCQLLKYAHRSLNISDTGLSSFQGAYGLQPPLHCLFANLDLSLNVPAACFGLLPAPTYYVSQKVQLPTRALLLTVESK